MRLLSIKKLFLSSRTSCLFYFSGMELCQRVSPGFSWTKKHGQHRNNRNERLVVDSFASLRIYICNLQVRVATPVRVFVFFPDWIASTGRRWTPQVPQDVHRSSARMFLSASWIWRMNPSYMNRFRKPDNDAIPGRAERPYRSSPAIPEWFPASARSLSHFALRRFIERYKVSDHPDNKCCIGMPVGACEDKVINLVERRYPKASHGKDSKTIAGVEEIQPLHKFFHD